jgi:hypothetical protein
MILSVTEGHDKPYKYPNIFARAEAVILNKYDTIFIDSITVAGRECFKWAKVQPETFNREGKPDTRGAYGLLGQEMIRWLTHLQHAPVSIIVVGILDAEKDDLNRWTYTAQVEGSKTGRELPGIFDQVCTLQNFKTEDGKLYRGICCQQQNEWNYPAKDRSGRLDVIEAPDLAALMEKIRKGKRLDETIQTSLPQKQG